MTSIGFVATENLKINEKEADAMHALFLLSEGEDKGRDKSKAKGKRKAQEELVLYAPSLSLKKTKNVAELPQETPADVIARLKTSSTARDLLERVNANQGLYGLKSVSLKFVPKAERPHTPPATSDPVTGEICIWTECTPNQKLCNLIFELLNLERATPQVNALVERIASGEISTAFDYALRIEEIEFTTVQAYPKVMRKCIEKDGWDESVYLEGPKLLWDSFESYWQAQCKGGHVQFYINQFEDVVANLKARSSEEETDGNL